MKQKAGSISLCVLMYGDYPDLARRCLSSLSLLLQLDAKHVYDFRLGLNCVSDATAQYVEGWAEEQWDRYGFRVGLYITDQRVGKYPLMRRMFYTEVLPEFVMWFDDDTYAKDPPADWWDRLFSSLTGNHMVGQCRWYMPVQGNQWQWIQSQPWYSPEVGPPPKFRGRRAFKFCQGAWWTIRSEVLFKLDWPLPELNHNGGDSLLGEVFRHQGLSMGFFDTGLAINADEAGRHSRAKRRGLSEPVLGKHYKGVPLPRDHQDFKMRRLVYGTYDWAENSNGE